MNSSDTAAARDLVRTYLADRYAWERRSFLESERANEGGNVDEVHRAIQASYEELLRPNEGGNVDEVHRAIQASYEELLRRYFVPRVMESKPQASFGDPPEVDPSGSVIQEISTRGGSVVVRTVEEVAPFPPVVHEYVLEMGSDGFRIVDRLARMSDGSWIHGVY